MTNSVCSTSFSLEELEINLYYYQSKNSWLRTCGKRRIPSIGGHWFLLGSLLDFLVSCMLSFTFILCCPHRFFSSQLLFNNLPNNPFLAIFSPKVFILSTPLRVVFSASSFLIHYFLAFNLSSQFRVYFYPYSDHTPVSYRFLYSISLLAPVASLFFGIPWKVGIWWSYTPLVVFAVHRVTNNIENIDREIANLEGMKYNAPGAWSVYHHAYLLCSRTHRTDISVTLINHINDF